MNKRILAGAMLLGGAAAFYRWQPLRFQFAPRPLSADNPPANFDTQWLFQPDTRITIVTAHPDDTEFYIAGLLLKLGAAGAALHLIVATDGDKGYYPFAQAARNRRIRQAEQRNAAAQWQAASVVFLGHPDGRLRCDEKLVSEIERELRRVQPEYVLLFDSIYPPRLTHQDHLRAGEAAFRAMQRSGIGGWALHFSTLAPNFAVNVSEQWTARMEVLPCHGSQWHDTRLRQVQGIITRNAIADGEQIGVRYAEGLRCVALPKFVIQ